MNLDLSWKNKWLSGGRMNINSCTTLVVFASCMRYFFLIIPLAEGTFYKQGDLLMMFLPTFET